MIRVSVVSTRQLLKSGSKILACCAIFIILINVLQYSNAHFKEIEISTDKCISYITDEITVMGNMEIADFSKINPEYILDTELKFSDTKIVYGEEDDSVEVFSNIQNQDAISNNSEQSNTNDVVQASSVAENIDIMDIPVSAKTEVIASTYKPTYNYKIDGVKIKNESSYDLSNINISSSNATINNKNVIIFHTHTCESYTQTDNNRYEASGNYRTIDLAHNVVRVGDVLQSYLTNYGFNVIHNKSYHDYPSYNGSYGRSLKTVSGILAGASNADIVIDVHRDAMADESYAPKVKIGDEYVSQLMFVIGTDGSGLKHDNWKSNLEFAIKVQKKADEMYPGLFKPIIVRNARYNQNLAPYASIIEFGATGNTLEECEAAAKYLSKVISELE